ncbi:DUF1576 domain-containing protein [Anaerococcus sp. ENR1011]|uniref:DUF1576 domain-containing protein n=1 Tax=Anaerococcus groningensis TaxID=3115616 RepID=A0ABW9MY22_9FIRM
MIAWIYSWYYNWISNYPCVFIFCKISRWLFSTTLAPIAGEFGFLAGVFAGFSHKAVATNTGLIHGGINLYNNGLAGGIVAAVLVPLYKDFMERRKRV